MSSPMCGGRSAWISRRKWVVRSAASILQRTSSVIHSGRAEMTRISSCQVSASMACCTISCQGAGGQGAVEVTESTLADGLDDVLGIGLAGQDHLGLRADGADAAEQFQRVEAVGAGRRPPRRRGRRGSGRGPRGCPIPPRSPGRPACRRPARCSWTEGSESRSSRRRGVKNSPLFNLAEDQHTMAVTSLSILCRTGTGK